jgi:hypothetical protein
VAKLIKYVRNIKIINNDQLSKICGHIIICSVKISRVFFFFMYQILNYNYLPHEETYLTAFGVQIGVGRLEVGGTKEKITEN